MAKYGEVHARKKGLTMYSAVDNEIMAKEDGLKTKTDVQLYKKAGISCNGLRVLPNACL